MASARNPTRKRGATRKPTRRAPAKPVTRLQAPGWLWAAVGAGVSALSALLLFLSFQPPQGEQDEQAQAAQGKPTEVKVEPKAEPKAASRDDGAVERRNLALEPAARPPPKPETAAKPKPEPPAKSPEEKATRTAETPSTDTGKPPRNAEAKPSPTPSPPPPPPPAPRFEFYSLLPEQEVAPLSAAPGPRRPLPAPVEPAGDAAGGEVSPLALLAKPPEAIDKPERLYALQVGSFPRYADAETRKAELALLGIQAQIEVALVGGKEVHRVRVGPLAGDSLGRTEALLRKNGLETQRYALTR